LGHEFGNFCCAIGATLDNTVDATVGFENEVNFALHLAYLCE